MLLPLTTLVESIQPRSQSICSIPVGIPSHPSFTWHSSTVTKMFCCPQSANRSAFKYHCFVVSCPDCPKSFSSSIFVLFLFLLYLVAGRASSWLVLPASSKRAVVAFDEMHLLVVTDMKYPWVGSYLVDDCGMHYLSTSAM
jgi:hypothetical protein